MNAKSPPAAPVEIAFMRGCTGSHTNSRLHDPKLSLLRGKNPFIIVLFSCVSYSKSEILYAPLLPQSTCERE